MIFVDGAKQVNSLNIGFDEADQYGGIQQEVVGVETKIDKPIKKTNRAKTGSAVVGVVRTGFLLVVDEEALTSARSWALAGYSCYRSIIVRMVSTSGGRLWDTSNALVGTANFTARLENTPVFASFNDLSTRLGPIGPNPPGPNSEIVRQDRKLNFPIASKIVRQGRLGTFRQLRIMKQTFT
ncbi:hypothetical protein J6590_056247 [Homalodisca vitripennis]|nr:hypothetical protein J6590_056247 [Homalodisca vitripennis]